MISLLVETETNFLSGQNDLDSKHCVEWRFHRPDILSEKEMLLENENAIFFCTKKNNSFWYETTLPSCVGEKRSVLRMLAKIG